MVGQRLRIAIICDRHDEGVDSWPLKAAMEKKGMEVTIFEHPQRAKMVDGIFYYDSHAVNQPFDGVVLQTWGGDDPLALAIQDHLVAQGAVAYNSTEAVRISQSKTVCDAIARANRIPTPESTGFDKSEDFDETSFRQRLEQIPGPPYVVKPDHGGQGKGVHVARLTEEEQQNLAAEILSPEEAREIQTSRAIAYIRETLEYDSVQVQEFIETRSPEEQDGHVKDIRVLVIGGKIVDAVQRTGGEGSMTAGISTGGTASKIELSDEERKMVLKTAKASGLNMLGVDLLRDVKQPGRTVLGEWNDAAMLRMHLQEAPDVYDRVAENIKQVVIGQKLGIGKQEIAR